MNAVVDAVRSINGVGKRIAAAVGIASLIGSTIGAFVFMDDRHAHASDLTSAKNEIAGQQQMARLEAQRASRQQSLRVEMRLNEIRRAQIDAQLREMAARAKAGISFDSDPLIEDSLKDERRAIIGQRIELQKLQREAPTSE